MSASIHDIWHFFHIFVINYLFDYYSVCLVYSSYRLLYESISIFYRGLQSPCPPGCCTHLIVIIKYTYNIAAQPYYCWWTQHRNNRTARSTLRIFRQKRRHFVTSYVQPVMQQYESTTVKRTFVIKVATMKITDDLMEAFTCLQQNGHFSWWTKMNGTQRRAPWRTHFMYSSMVEGTSRAGATSKSKKIRPVALAIVEVREYEGIRQAGRQLVSQKIPLNKFLFKFCSNFLKAFRINLKAFMGLLLPNQYCHIIM